MTDKALLALADGTVFHGLSVGVSGISVGEVVFNTAMTGYQEILTDPSYAKQLVTLTYPHIGNVGCNPEDAESTKVHAAGLIVRDLPKCASNWRAKQDLPSYLDEHKVVAIAELDTRALTRILREKGAQNGAIMCGPDANEETAIAAARDFPGLVGMDLAKEVSTDGTYQYDSGTWELAGGYAEAPAERPFKVVAYDFGVKHNILRLLVDRGCDLTVVPAKTPLAEVLAMQPDGVFLSNGPGDPQPCDYAIDAIGELLDKKIPTFGICLGHQLLGLAAGAKTVKMKFGHHGANHPVKDLATEQVMITSQNHGFAIDEASLPANVKATHRSLFDDSLQGIELTDRPAFSFQGHPEASPGPHDIQPLFDRFIASMDENRNA